MKYSVLGKSELKISKIAFGCMSLTGTSADASKLLHRAVDLGINYFDTADLYEQGANEIKVGEGLQGHRDKVFIATKVGNQMRSDGSGWDWNPRKTYILKAVEESLKRLKTEYIDLYQLHGGTIDDPIDEVIETFETLKQQGKIRFYGISSIRPNVVREYVKRSGIVSLMSQFSLLDQRPARDIFPLLEESNIGLLVRGAVAQGLLVDKPAREYLGRPAAEVGKAADCINEISGIERTKAQTALLFALQQKPVSAVVVGVRTLEQLEEAAKAFDVPALTQEEMEVMRKAVQPNFYTEHV